MWRGVACIAVAWSCGDSDPDPCEPVPVATCSDCAVKAALQVIGNGEGTPVAVGADGAAEVGSCDRVYRVGGQGDVEGSITMSLDPSSRIGRVVASPDGDVYAEVFFNNPGGDGAPIGGALLAFDAGGGQRWSKSELFSNLAADHEGLYAESVLGLPVEITALNVDGTTRWSMMAPDAIHTWIADLQGSFIIANNSAVENGSPVGSIVKLDVGGNGVWQKTVATPVGPDAMPAVDFEGLAAGADGAIAVVCEGFGTSLELGDASIPGTGMYVVMLDAAGHTLWGRQIDTLANPEIAIVGSSAVVVGTSLTDTTVSVVVRVETTGATPMIELMSETDVGPRLNQLRTGPDNSVWFVAEPQNGTFDAGGAAVPHSDQSQYNFLFNVGL